MHKLILSFIILVGLSSHASEAVKGAQKDYEAFKKEMSAKMDSIETELVELKQKAKTKGKLIKEESVHEIEAKRDDLKKKMSQLGDASKDTWKDLKKGISESADSLHTKLQKALAD